MGGLLIYLAGNCGSYRSSPLIPCLKGLKRGDGEQINVNDNNNHCTVALVCTSSYG